MRVREIEIEGEREREFGLEFSKPAHTRPQMLRTQALIIIQNWTFKLTYSPLVRERQEKETNNREKKQTSNTFDQSHVLGSARGCGISVWALGFLPAAGWAQRDEIVKGRQADDVRQTMSGRQKSGKRILFDLHVHAQPFPLH